MSSEGPPVDLVRALVEGPSAIAGLEWHSTVTSTNELALEAALRGVPEIHLVGADHQSAGRGRRGRLWLAPSGTSLLLSMVCRPAVPPSRLTLLPLLAAVATADALRPHAPGRLGVKWPNDVLIGERKVSGILVESPDAGTAVVGIGVNVDWRDVERPVELAGATSLAEEVAQPVDRWRVLAAVAGLFAARYSEWVRDPLGVLPAYQAGSVTLGRRVRVRRPGGPTLEGLARAIDDSGALVVSGLTGEHRVTAGEVEHLRPVG